MEISIKDLHARRAEIANIARASGACKSEPDKLDTTTSNEEAFFVVFENYGWLKNNTKVTVMELENATRESLASFYIWLLETYCIGKEVDEVVQRVIDLHKRALDGGIVSANEWDDASDPAWSAARNYATSAAWSTAGRGVVWSAARDAAWLAGSAVDAGVRDAVWSAACTKLHQVLTA